MRFAAGFRMLLVGSLVGSLAGCGSTRSTRDRNLDAAAPWCGPGERAQVVSVTRHDGVVGAPLAAYRWSREGDRFPIADSREMDAAVFDYLRRIGVWQRDAGASSSATPIDETMSADQANLPSSARFPFTHTLSLVCVDPPICVSVPVPGYGLPRAATTLPYSPVVRWFDPTGNTLPATPEVVDVDHVRVPVSWGWLVLRHEGANWVVRGVGR